MSKRLAGLQGVLNLMDILVFEPNRAEHDQRLLAVLNQIKEKGPQLNSKKCARLAAIH